MIGIVYKITFRSKYRPDNEDANLCYIGSTITSLDARFSQHRSHFNSWLRGIKCTTLSIFPYYEKYDYAAFEISLVKRLIIEDIHHLRAYEQLAINRYKCINKKACFNPFVKVAKNTLARIRHQNNRESNNEKFSCECGGRYTKITKYIHITRQKHINYLKAIIIDELS